jgi:hypothetical protein
MPFEHAEHTDGWSAQPETVATLLRQLGVRNASGGQEADALRPGSVTLFQIGHFG